MRQCALCGKGSVIRGKRKLLRGHYNPTSRSRKYPNLQWARLPLRASPPAKQSEAARGTSGQAKVRGRRMLICTDCLRKLHR